MLTELLINEHIEYAKSILSSCYLKFNPPKIVKVRISKARSYWAQIKHIDEDRYELAVSNVFDDIVNEQLFYNRLTSCMIHELIHTIPGCWNHGKIFKKIANKVNTRFPEYQIQTSTYDTDYGIPETVQIIRYVVTCKNCGAESKYTRRPKIWSYLDSNSNPYYCCRCGKSEFSGVKF